MRVSGTYSLPYPTLPHTHTHTGYKLIISLELLQRVLAVSTALGDGKRLKVSHE